MSEIIFGNRKLTTEKPAFVMGIVNATPDSFFNKSRGDFDLAMKLISEGADVLDIGGESTRPGFTEVPVDEEIERVVPLIELIRKNSDIPISIDTRKAAVFREAYKAGVDVLNDVSSLADDPHTLDELLKTDAGLILMHRLPEEKTNDGNAETIIQRETDFFEERISLLESRNYDLSKLIVDPGIGFGKNFEEHLKLIKDCNQICNGKYPVLMALSRKRCIGQMTGREIEDRMVGTVTADIISVQNGASMIRVHDVKEAVDSLNVMKYLTK